MALFFGLSIANAINHGGFMTKMTLNKTLAILFTLLSSTLVRAQMPPFSSVRAVEIDGSGCDAGSANAIITSDLNFLSVLYDRFSVEIGKGTANPGKKAAEKNCTVNVTVEVPAGWNFTFDSIDYRGYVQLPNKMTLAYQLITAEAYGGRGIGFEQNSLQGPKNQNFVTTVKNKGVSVLGSSNPLDQIIGLGNAVGAIKNQINTLSSGSFMGCSDQTQNVKIKIKSIIGVRNLLGQLTKPAVRLVVDSTDASFRQNLKLNWKRCN